MVISKKLTELIDAISSKDELKASRLIGELSKLELPQAANNLFTELQRRFSSFSLGSFDLPKVSNGVDLGRQLELFYGNHRSGWSFAVNAIAPINDESGIYLDTFIERTFTWAPEGVKPIKKPWVGFIHVPPNVPSWFQYEQSNDAIFETDAWKQSLPYCQGLFTLSEYHKKELEKRFNFPIVNLIHPTEIPEKQWDWDRFKKNNDKKIIQVGWYLRKQHAIYQLPCSSYRKIHLKVTEQQYLKDLIARERAILIEEGEFTDSMYETVDVVSFLENEDYDNWLSENLVFVYLYDASANNAVIECIARGTPLLVNPLPSVIEYLGENYPFYYDSYEEAVEKASNFELVKKTHQYLVDLPLREKLSGEYFCNAIQSSILVNNPTLTVVTVVFNDKYELRKTIESVVNQDYPSVEYIVIDGGSTDGTLDVIKEFSEHITYWVSEPDKGIYDAMNKAVKVAKSDWINFLNAGDRFCEVQTLSKLADKLEADADLSYGDTYFESEESRELKKATDPSTLWKALNFNHNALFVKKELLKQHPFNLDYKIVADSEFVIWCYTSGKKFQHIDMVINNYKCGGFSDINSVMRTVERWQLVSEYKMRPQKEINDFYFQRLLWEKDCQSYLKHTYGIDIEK